jgi:hypothetical protein
MEKNNQSIKVDINKTTTIWVNVFPENEKNKEKSLTINKTYYSFKERAWKQTDFISVSEFGELVKSVPNHPLIRGDFL